MKRHRETSDQTRQVHHHPHPSPTHPLCCPLRRPDIAEDGTDMDCVTSEPEHFGVTQKRSSDRGNISDLLTPSLSTGH